VPATRFQFHVDPDEAWELACRWASEYGLSLAAEQYFPEYRVAAVTLDASECVGTDGLERIDRAALSRRPPDLEGTTTHEFVTRNEDCLYLSIGRYADGTLRESALSGDTDDPDTLRIWRRLIRRARSEMHKGAAARSPHSRSVQRLPNHRHTSGAHALAVRGVRMLAFAGTTEYVFDDVVP
jgi:hypothetical protein